MCPKYQQLQLVSDDSQSFSLFFERGDPNRNKLVFYFLRQDKAGAPRIGQDAVTSERFWEVTEGYFAEGHKEGWLEKLLDIEHLPKDDDPVFKIPDKNSKKDKDEDDEKEKEKSDRDKPPTKQQKPASPRVTVIFRETSFFFLLLCSPNAAAASPPAAVVARDFLCPYSFCFPCRCADRVAFASAAC